MRRRCSSAGFSFLANALFSFIHIIACFRGHCCLVFSSPIILPKRGTEVVVFGKITMRISITCHLFVTVQLLVLPLFGVNWNLNKSPVSPPPRRVLIHKRLIYYLSIKGPILPRIEPVDKHWLKNNYFFPPFITFQR